VLLLLAVAADRIALLVAERIAGDEFQRSQNLPQRPSVSIAGFPFLTQVATGDYDAVSVAAKGLVIGSAQHPLRLSNLDVRLDQVVVTHGFHDLHARRGTAAATVSYPELSKTLHTPISYAGNGRIRTTKTVTVLGRSVTATASAAPHATSAQGLTFGSVRVHLSGIVLPSSVNNVFTQIFAVPIPLGNLPFGVTVQRIDTTAAGIVIHLSGSNLSYTRS
jgi:hypothetical protein